MQMYNYIQEVTYYIMYVFKSLILHLVNYLFLFGISWWCGHPRVNLLPGGCQRTAFRYIPQ